MVSEFFVKLPFRVMERDLAKSLTGKTVWGDLEISAEEYEQLKYRIRKKIGGSEDEFWKFLHDYPVSFVTFLVFLVRYQYDVNFWGLLRNELEVSFPVVKEAEIGKLARTMFTTYKFDFSDALGDKRVNLGPILLEAGLPPESCMDDLFYILKYDRQTAFDPQLLIDDLIEMRSYQIRKPMIRFLERFRNDRAIEYVVNVHEAILCVDQHMALDSDYVDRYLTWKENEHTKSGVAARKKQEFQTRPYLWFENGSRGLCLVLPRTVLKDEWIEDVQWRVSIGKTVAATKNMAVFGDEGMRYVESISVPVGPAPKYLIELLDNEGLEGAALQKWEIDGIGADDAIWFNQNGRMVRAASLPAPYGILVMGERATIRKTEQVEITNRSYPTDRRGYTVSEIIPCGSGAALEILTKAGTVTLGVKPQLRMYFEGPTLFSVPCDEQPVFTGIPELIIETDEDADVTGLEVRIGKANMPVERLPGNGRTVLRLNEILRERETAYGTFSVRLYQQNHFLKQAEFFYVPPFETDYCPLLSWPRKGERKRPSFTVQRREDWMLEFQGCVVRTDPERYLVECPAGIGEISVLLRSLNEDAPFSMTIRLPVNPVALTVTDGTGEAVRTAGELTRRVGMQEWNDTPLWLSAAFYGEFQRRSYSVKLRTVNGIEQSERLPMSYSHYGNMDLSVFRDTLRNCPLPAQLELWCEAEENSAIPVLILHDDVQLRDRPRYVSEGFLELQGDYRGNDFVLRRFGAESAELRLSESEYRETHGYGLTRLACGTLPEGIYVMETEQPRAVFEFEEAAAAIPTNGNSTFLICGETDEDTFSGWLDRLIADILQSGISGSLRDSGSPAALTQIETMEIKSLREADCEKLIALACFAVSPCSDEKKRDIIACMDAISEKLLTGALRAELIRCMEWIDCPEGVFELCLERYQLLLFQTLGENSGRIAEKLDSRSPELAMLIRMRADEPMRSTIRREKYLELIGRESLLSMISVPGVQDRKRVIEEQRRFLREESGSQVQITLNKDISGNMEPLQQMIEFRKNQIVFNTDKRPDEGVYFDHIRYVDQYINWYILSFTKDGEMKKDISDRMVRLVTDYGKHIVSGLREAKNDTVWGGMVRTYEKALRARYEKDPLSDLKHPIPARYFFLLGIAALLAQLPGAEGLPAWNVRSAEQYVRGALAISPRIGKRDILMAQTYIYLSRKEKQLCR